VPGPLIVLLGPGAGLLGFVQELLGTPHLACVQAATGVGGQPRDPLKQGLGLGDAVGQAFAHRGGVVLGQDAYGLGGLMMLFGRLRHGLLKPCGAGVGGLGAPVHTAQRLFGGGQLCVKGIELACGREEAVRRGLANPGDRVVVTAGLPMHRPGTTNLLQVEVI
jgi:hypothetical protein